MALLPGAGDTARQFYAFLQAPAAREVLSRYGFAFPD
jgi:molybdate transport system substrate-binding protein